MYDEKGDVERGRMQEQEGGKDTQKERRRMAAVESYFNEGSEGTMRPH